MFYSIFLLIYHVSQAFTTDHTSNRCFLTSSVIKLKLSLWGIARLLFAYKVINASNVFRFLYFHCFTKWFTPYFRSIRKRNLVFSASIVFCSQFFLVIYFKVYWCLKMLINLITDTSKLCSYICEIKVKLNVNTQALFLGLQLYKAIT